MFSDRRLHLKKPAEISLMRAAGLVVGQTLEALRAAVAPGVTTADLDALAEERIRASGAVPSFLGYHGYPASICTSVNDEVVHGIPGGRTLREGDLISIDCGAIVDGWHGDAAITVPVGEVEPRLLELARVCEEALWRGLAAVRTGGRLSDVSAAVEAHVRGQGDYGIVEDYVGHGIGTQMHMPPNVPNLGKPGKGPRLQPGLTIAVEPMITLGSQDTDVLEDDWTVVTRDGGTAAHVEHTVALTESGPWVLTALDGGAAKFAELGISVGGQGHQPVG
ncbi:type I methionyl aminopeptidase [Actinopolymorpha singaporensis]|uniref:Methionine aminopeptidase n=1 Tax=Actinopolymorpha singaporensis TaxID=117157 RepID=A0A1H1SDK0_9ACTN|nr:type I methionyl aminopeptidase [Actinopolymorpha singaporensis]SDS45796.1 methionine aminopeptidase, type I [Actinopolymorpha singaporensis]